MGQMLHDADLSPDKPANYVLGYIMKMTLLIMVGLLGLVACHRSDLVEGGMDADSDTGQPALHAIHDQALRELMDRMDVLMHERFMTETQLDQERYKYAQRIAQTALKLSNTVEAIIAKMPLLGLTTQEQGTFIALANKLSQQTHDLREQATQNHIDTIDQSLHQINTTCISCHALFRKIGH